ncbi:xaa-Pro aminopeptidase 2 [Platysternon megacephalum]|uniref:Xaa-Pro aminopeptidase 2 n=1 Tax=Platysternon megacephalum TaxID=55544 RepID=A0A4D9DHR4_9SAUR|nr:xaa-Pro aminopeptidase 2 [Platysternon megacephalum]
MGGRYSSPLDGRQRRYLRGRTDATVKNFMPYYQRQLATTFLRRVSKELDPHGKPALQLLQSKLQKPPDALLHEGFLMQHNGDTCKWKKSYFILLGNCTLEWFDSKEAQGKGYKPRGSTTLSGYLLVTSLSEYNRLIDHLCQGLVVDYTHQDQDPLNGPPEEFLLFLYHPFRKSFCFCTNSAKSQHTWKSVLQDGIRYCSTVLQRQDSFEVEAFLEAVRFYRQEKGSYGAGDLLLGTEPEILSNVLMEDLLPVLQSQVPPNLKGSESRKKQTWCQFLEEVYTLVLSQVSSEFLDFQRENEKLHIQLEKKIRPDLDQMLILKDQISIKLQAVIQNPVESCCRQGVEPDLDCVMEELIRPISLGFDVVRSLFTDRIAEMIRHVQSLPTTVFQEEVLTLGEMPWKPGFMEPCYEKANLYKDSLQGLKEKFGFHGVASLVLRAENLMQQLMQNSVHTFHQLSEQHLSLATNHSQITQTLEKIKTRVLKKFDYDSSSTRKQFAQEWLVQIFLPFLLKNLEPRCKLELPKYENYVFADFSGIINVENIYEEMVLAVLQQAVTKALKEASSQNRHNLYSDSYSCVLESVDNLLQQDRAQEHSEIRTGALGDNATSDTVNLISCQVSETTSDKKTWKYEGSSAGAANPPKDKGRICPVTSHCHKEVEKSLRVLPDGRNWRHKKALEPDMQSSCITEPAGHVAEKTAVVSEAENNMCTGNPNKNKCNDKSWNSFARSKDIQEPQDIINEHSVDKAAVEKIQGEWGRAVFEQGGQGQDGELELNRAWIKGAGQSGKNNQKYRELLQDQDGPCEEPCNYTFFASTSMSKNQSPTPDSTNSDNSQANCWPNTNSLQVMGLDRDTYRDNGGLTEGKLQRSATNHVASIEWDGDKLGENRSSWEMQTISVSKGKCRVGEACNGQMISHCPFSVKETRDATWTHRLQEHGDEMIAELHVQKLAPAEGLERKICQLELGHNVQEEFKGHRHAGGLAEGKSAPFLLTGSLRYEDEHEGPIPGHQEESSQVTCQTLQSQQEMNKEEMTEADFNEIDKTVFLECLSIAIEMEIFQTDLLEMDLEDNRDQGSGCQQTEPLK